MVRLINFSREDEDAVLIQWDVLRRGLPDWAAHFEAAFDFLVCDPHECGAPCAIACTWRKRWGTRAVVLKMRPSQFSSVDGGETLRHESDHVVLDQWGRSLMNPHTVFDRNGRVDQINDPIYRRGILLRPKLEQAWAELLREYAPQPAEAAGVDWGQVVGAAVTGVAAGAILGLGISALASLFGGNGRERNAA